jgi:hypothetical protein
MAYIEVAVYIITSFLTALGITLYFYFQRKQVNLISETMRNLSQLKAQISSSSVSNPEIVDKLDASQLHMVTFLERYCSKLDNPFINRFKEVGKGFKKFYVLGSISLLSLLGLLYVSYIVFLITESKNYAIDSVLLIFKEEWGSVFLYIVKSIFSTATIYLIASVLIFTWSIYLFRRIKSVILFLRKGIEAEPRHINKQDIAIASFAPILALFIISYIICLFSGVVGYANLNNKYKGEDFITSKADSILTKEFIAQYNPKILCGVIINGYIEEYSKISKGSQDSTGSTELYTIQKITYEMLSRVGIDYAKEICALPYYSGKTSDLVKFISYSDSLEEEMLLMGPDSLSILINNCNTYATVNDYERALKSALQARVKVYEYSAQQISVFEAYETATLYSQACAEYKLKRYKDACKNLEKVFKMDYQYVKEMRKDCDWNGYDSVKCITDMLKKYDY